MMMMMNTDSNLGPKKFSLISGFGLFCSGNTYSNLGPEENPLISEFLLYPRYTVPVRALYVSQIELFNHLLRTIIINYLKPYSNE